MDAVNNFMSAINAFLWHDIVLYLLLGTGIFFTFYSGFCQYRAITHGTRVLRGSYDDPNDPGCHQPLPGLVRSTVGDGRPRQHWRRGARRFTGRPRRRFLDVDRGLLRHVHQAHRSDAVDALSKHRRSGQPARRTDVGRQQGDWRWNPKWATLGKVLGGVFCVTLLVSTITGGNMFQAWNVGEITQEYFGIPSVATGIVLAMLVGMVIIGGIKRIGSVAGRLVPTMVTLYMLAAIYVLFVHFGKIPEMLKLIVVSAFQPTEATGAFIGGTVGYAFLFGMKRALFSNEAGQGSSPIAHSAAKTDEPVREGIVAGLEPFIDTLIVCTMTALVIISTGVWNRGAEVVYEQSPAVVPVDLNQWSVEELRSAGTK